MNKGNLMGKKFERVTVIRLDRVQGHHNYWFCRCDCGTEFVTIGNNLSRGLTKSCGCLRRETTSLIMKTHGDCKTKFYYIWGSLKGRTQNKKNKRYGDYGGRGINICAKWLEYEGFKDDMYLLYLEHCREFGESNTTIERKDVNGDYYMDNCTWATYQEQNSNKRTTVRLELHGQKYSLTEITEKFNINRTTFSERLKKGWSVERSVLTPANYRFLNVASQ